jgi:hypothetical protein
LLAVLVEETMRAVVEVALVEWLYILVLILRPELIQLQLVVVGQADPQVPPPPRTAKMEETLILIFQEQLLLMVEEDLIMAQRGRLVALEEAVVVQVLMQVEPELVLILMVLLMLQVTGEMMVVQVMLPGCWPEVEEEQPV